MSFSPISLLLYEEISQMSVKIRSGQCCQKVSTTVLSSLNCAVAEQHAAAPLGGPYAILLIAFMFSNIISFKQYFV